MKKFTFLTFLAMAFVSAVIFMSSCTKEGPMGQTGAQGDAGPAGEDGINGTDGTAGCIECHDGGQSQGMFAQTVQWEASIHATGGNFERNASYCGNCHTSQGFVEQTTTGSVAGTIQNPNPINCYTCHNIHDTYTPADLALTTTAAVTPNAGTGTFDFGKGNLCANCHQSRPISPFPELGGADVTFTSYRYGGHHGPQANVLAGVGFMEFSGAASYGGDVHAQATDGCVTCHMATAYGIQAGGHTMSMTYEYHGHDVVNEAGCFAAGCHADGDDIEGKVVALQAEVADLLDDLKALLIAEGIYDDGSHGHEGYAVTGTWPASIAGAWLTYQMVLEDRSFGVHNPVYVKGLLNNTIDELTP